MSWSAKGGTHNFNVTSDKAFLSLHPLAASATILRIN